MPAEPGVPDRDRPLAERGHRDAGLIGAAIAEAGQPDCVICSPALRTRQTMEEVLARFPDDPEQVIADPLYGGNETAYLQTIAKRGGTARRLLVVGHNPAIHLLALALAKAPGAKLRAKFPTSALAVLAFDADDWTDVRPAMGKLETFLRPKDLGARDADD
jgi:phosphohistidine phosphatase